MGGFSVDPKVPKHKDFVNAATRYQMDVLAIQEVGINFTYSGVNGQWKTRLGWNSLLDSHKAKTVNAWNSQSHQRKLQQYGGTTILALGRTAFYAAGSGRDPTNLGRWCWTHY